MCRGQRGADVAEAAGSKDDPGGGAGAPPLPPTPTSLGGSRGRGGGKEV